VSLIIGAWPVLTGVFLLVRTPSELAWTMHEGIDFRGHASEYLDVEALCRCAEVILPPVSAPAIDCRLRYSVGA
jgi:hypothetical protein